MTTLARLLLLVLIGTLTNTGLVGAAALRSDAVEGAWSLLEYRLADGRVHPLAGTIFFLAGRWQVAFFVLDADGAPQRASAEGGTYSIEGSRLVFHHELNFSFGNELPGLPPSELRMSLRSADEAAAEPVAVEISAGTMLVDFPSGNRIRFERVTS